MHGAARALGHPNRHGTPPGATPDTKCHLDHKHPAVEVWKADLQEAVLDGCPAAIYAKDTLGRYILVNRQYESLFHITRQQITGKTDHDLFPAEQADVFRANDEAVLHAGVPMEWEESVTVNGTLRTYISLKFPLYDSAGVPYAIAGVSTDITKRKQTEEELRETQERFRLLISSVRDHGLLMLDPNGYVVSWNAGAERIMGYQAEAIIGEPCSRFYVPEDVASRRPEEELRLAVDNGISEVQGWRVRKNGSQYWAHVTTTALRDEHGELTGFAHVVREGLDRNTGGAEVGVRSHALDLAPPVIAESAAMRAVLRFVQRVASSETTTILLGGENGTGKDLIAKILHHQSRRQSEPFIAINCAAIPETLLESELFGYEKGAFTDARAQKKGTFELAHNGTLFLDEIGELPLVLQAKLLRVLEEQSFRRLGGLKDIQLDLRVVAATNRNLLQAVDSGAFRQDLYFRLNVISIEIPPLRDRPDDILPLAYLFLGHYNRKFDLQIGGISGEAGRFLLRHRWPGNVRELRNAIEHAMILENCAVLTPTSLPISITTPSADAELRLDARVQQSSEEIPTLCASERRLLVQALEKAGGIQTRAARLLHITRDKMRYKMKKFGLL